MAKSDESWLRELGKGLMSCQATDNLVIFLSPPIDAILKFLKFRKLPKAGPTNLRRHKSPGDPRTNLMFLRVLRSEETSYLEARMDSVGAACIRLATRER